MKRRLNVYVLSLTLVLEVCFSEQLDFELSIPKKVTRRYSREIDLIPEESEVYTQPIGFGGFGPLGFGAGYSGFGGFGGTFGGQKNYANQKEYDTENKKVQEEDHKKAYGAKGQTNAYGNQAFNEGHVAVKDNKADKGYFNGASGANKQSGDNKEYHSAKHIDEQGKAGEQNNAKRGHKKGHSRKGFKTSAHKDEEEKSETFYDEEHDEAEDSRIKGSRGSYGQKEESNYKGGKEENMYNNAQKGQEGKYEKANVLDNSKGEKGQFNQQQHANNEASYGMNKGMGAQSVLGHQEAAGGEKHYANKIVPYYSGY